MTRLRNEDINSIIGKLYDFDRKLVSIIGHNLKDLAILASDLNISKEVEKRIGTTLVGVVPISSGKGIIEDFSNTLVSIACHIGFKAFVTRNTDLRGFAEAIDMDCDILIMSDDDVFIAYNCRTGKISNNDPATANGFVTALEVLAGGLEGTETLVLGAGPIGKFSIKKLLEKGSNVALYDKNPEKSKSAKKKIEINFPDRIKIEENIKIALASHRYILDATPASDIIDEADISIGSLIVAPGVPLGLTEAAEKKAGNRLLHDNLRIGTATMLIKALKAEENK